MSSSQLSYINEDGFSKEVTFIDILKDMTLGYLEYNLSQNDHIYMEQNWVQKSE